MQWYKSKVLLCIASQIKRNTMELKEVQRKLVRIIMNIHVQRRMENTEFFYSKESNKAGYKKSMWAYKWSTGTFCP